MSHFKNDLDNGFSPIDGEGPDVLEKEITGLDRANEMGNDYQGNDQGLTSMVGDADTEEDDDDVDDTDLDEDADDDDLEVDEIDTAEVDEDAVPEAVPTDDDLDDVDDLDLDEDEDDEEDDDL